MIKKIGLSLLSVFAILFVWNAFANPMSVDITIWCDKLENVEIDNYITVITTDRDNRDIFNYYIPQKNQIIKVLEGLTRKNPLWAQAREEVWVLNKTINTNTITEDIINNNAFFIWYIWGQDVSSESDCDKIKTYEIINNWNSYELVLSKTKNMKKLKGIKNKIKNKLIEFPIVRFLTIMLETFILFIISKNFRDKEQISNKRIILYWIIPTTITLPLLWFVLPLILWDGIRYIVAWELLVMAIESIIIKYWLKIKRMDAIIASAICNVLSFFILSDDYLTSDLRTGFFIPRFSVILIEVTILFISRKFRKEEWISNKRLILIWILTSTVTLPLLYIRSDSVNPDYIFIALRIAIQTLILRRWLKISWKKAITLSIVCNLLSCIMLSIFSFNWSYLRVYHDGVPWIYDDIPNFIMDLLGL